MSPKLHLICKWELTSNLSRELEHTAHALIGLSVCILQRGVFKEQTHYSDVLCMLFTQDKWTIGTTQLIVLHI